MTNFTLTACILLSACAILLTCLPASTTAAPASSGAARVHRHSRRHQPNPWVDDADAYTPDQRQWVNTCGRSSNVHPSARPKASGAAVGDQTAKHNRLLSTLRLAVEVYNSKMGSLHVIKTDDIAEWFTHNGTYKFLHRNNLTDKRINLRKWHTDTQIYVGAFQNLAHKQRLYDMLQNDGYSQSNELVALLSLAKQLLCELQYAIERSGGRTPPLLTRPQMDQRLRFRAAHAPDSVDLRFAKVRFAEYLDGLRQLLSPSGGAGDQQQLQLQPKSLRTQRQRLLTRKHALAKQRQALRNSLDRMTGEQRARAERQIAELERKQLVVKDRLKRVMNRQKTRNQNKRSGPKVGVTKELRLHH